MVRRLWVVGCLAAAGVVFVPAGPAVAGAPSVPRPDHVVVVLEENHGYGDIIGNAAAPYVNELAGDGALLTSSYALGPGSQPNYLALFSGSTQGVADQTCPLRFTGPSLGSQLDAAGFSFTGYAESLPSVGFTGCFSGSTYVRRHNPWVNFTAIPAAENQPFANFPTDYTTLPSVSWVVPNLDDDMHDGTIAQGDSWLRDNLGAYADWAQTHNSLLVVAFDEDRGNAAGHVATIVTGEHVRPGAYDETVTHYSVLRTIEDAFGLAPLGAAATAEPLLDIWAPPAGDAEPTASFVPSCTGLSCTFDASGSTDPDGSVAGYRWDFGDGTGSTDPAPTHVYAAGGPTRVRLTVTDDAGATGIDAQQLQLTDPSAFAADAFDRSLSGGWGAADVGGAWTTGGSGTFSVDSGAASMTAAAAPATLTASLGTVRRIDADLRLSAGVSAVPTGGVVTLSVSGRRVSSSTEYAARLLFKTDHTIGLRIVRVVNGTETVLADLARVIGFDSATLSPIDLRVQVTGRSPTTVRAKAWLPRDGEPAAWQVTKTDSTSALQGPGAVGLGMTLASGVSSRPITARFGPLSVARTADSAPVASFTSTCTQRNCTFDAAASADYDGTITDWAWTFGDGSSASGPTAQHSYATPGTYPVTLTVSDDESATGTTQHTVSVLDVYAKDAFGRTVSGGWGTADIGGPWSLTGSAASFAVTQGTAGVTLRASPSTLGACLCAVSQSGADVSVTVSPSVVPTGAPAYFEVEGRRLASRTGYAAKLLFNPDRTMTLRLVRVQAGTETIIGAPVRVPGATVAAGRAYSVRVQVTGTAPTTLRARAWTTSAAEPTSWLVTASDSTAALQNPGAVGVVAILPSQVTSLPLTFRLTAFQAAAA